jgi:hypothetical protein
MYINKSFKKIVNVIIALTVIISLTDNIHSQELNASQLDSLYLKFVQLRAPDILPQNDKPFNLSLENIKCGFGLVSQVRVNLDKFILEQRNILKTLLVRPIKQASMVSPSGFFRIHYDISGSEVPNYDPSLTVEENVQQVALAADSTYRFEVEYLGFPGPPNDNGAGGDNLFDIYITDADQNYGFTQPETHLGNDKYDSYIEIHYSFLGQGFATHGLEAMRVTVAHEFHHAIQMGNYILRLDDRFFYELTSTSMEEFVYDNVNDYYAYMGGYFNNPARQFTRFLWGTTDGYDLAIWNFYLEKNYGFGIIKRQWEMMPNQRAILAIGNSILERTSTFAREYNKFGIWTYYTNYRAVSSQYFEEAANYPLIKPSFIPPAFTPPAQTIEIDAQACSNNFIKFNISINSDTLYALITNGNISAVNLPVNQKTTFTYTLFSDGASGNRKLTEDYSSYFNSADPNWWSGSEILNGLLVRQDSTIIPGTVISESYVFPNPFMYKGNLSISIEGKEGEELDFNVYSSDMTLVHTAKLAAAPLLNNTIGINWNGKDGDGNRLTSGVYIVVIKNGDDIFKGKVVIFNE